MKVFWMCLILSLALVAPLIAAQSPANGSHAIPASEWQIVVLANQARAQAGAGPLKWDAALAEAARQHCLRMAAEGAISHQYNGEPDPGQRASQAGASFSLIEENVAFGPDPATIHVQWMHSPPHRENLLNPEVDHVGVALVPGRGGLYAVADYERAVAQLTQNQVETAVAALVKAHGVAILPDAALARSACAVDDGLPRAASGPQPRFIMRWQDAELAQLPQALLARLAKGGFHQAEVGSCPVQGQGPQAAFSAYRVAVLLY
jgi:hypothetical protein